MPGWS